MIADVREVADEAPAKESEEGEEITSDLAEDDEVKEEEEGDMAEEDNMMKDMMDRIQNLEDAIADLKGDKENKMEEEEVEEEMSTEKTLKSRTVKEEFSEVSSKPIKHNPEGSSSKKTKVEFGKGKFNTTLDRVLNKLNK